MKKIIITITFLLCANSFVSAQYEKLTHYNLHTNNLELVFLGGQSFVAYGENGNVLRTENSFETWKQEFSGIHNDIVKIQYVNENLYGITKQGDFIWSEDKGNHWQSKKISETILTDFYSDNGTFYISKQTDSVMYSNDYGKTWQSIYVTTDTLTAVFSFNNQIIVNRNYKEILVYKDNKWNKLELPDFAKGFPFIELKNKNNNLYLFTSTQFAKLENNLEWKENNIKESGIKDVLETDSELICFGYNSFSKKAKVVYYNKSDEEVTRKEEFGNPYLHSYCHHLNQGGIDDEGNMIVTASAKTIFTKSVSEDKWNTATSFMIPVVDVMIRQYIKDKNNWVYNSSDGNFVKTTDGGVSFQHGQYFKNDTIDEENIITRYITHVEFKSLDSITVQLSSGDSVAKSYDGGMTFHKELFIKEGLWRASKFRDFEGFSVYVEGFTQFEDYTLFYKVIDNQIVDTLMRIDDLILKNINMYNGKLLILAEIPDSNIYQYYLTDTDFKNPEIIYSFNYNTDKHQNSSFGLDEYLIDDEDRIYIMMKELLRKNNKFSYSLTKVFKIDNFDTPPDLIYNKPVHLYNYGVALGEDKLVTIGIQDTTTLELEYYLGKTIIDNGFEYELLGKLENGVMKVFHAVDDNSSYFYNKQGNFWKPIEEDRIPTNVVEENRPPAIWTYPPYPNPAINYTEMYFYTEIPSQINSLDINIINIATGKTIKNIDYIITNETNWSRTFRIFTNSLSSGSYLISLQLGNDRNIQKLIVIR